MDQDVSAQTWRPLLITRISFVALAVVYAGGAVATVGYAIVSGDVASISLALALLVVAVPFLLAVRMRVTITASHLEYRNLGGIRRLRWNEIQRATPGYWGITLVLADTDGFGARAATAMAVQKWNLSKWFHRHTRADRLVELIEQYCGGGDDGRPPARGDS